MTDMTSLFKKNRRKNIISKTKKQRRLRFQQGIKNKILFTKLFPKINDKFLNHNYLRKKL